MRDQRWWTWHVAAGVVVLLLLGLHMAIMHLDTIVGAFNAPGTEPIDWRNVVARGRTVFYTASYIVLLAAALFHGLYGLRTIVLELNPGRAFRRALTVVLVVAGAGLFGVGTWAAWASFMLARQL